MGNNGMTGFAEWLSKVKKEHKVTDTELGAYLGVSAPAVIRWRRGQVLPRDADTLDKMADYFGVDRTYVRGLAGRGHLGDEQPALDQFYVEIAYGLQKGEEGLETPEFRQHYRERLKRKHDELIDEFEMTSTLITALNKRKHE